LPSACFRSSPTGHRLTPTAFVGVGILASPLGLNLFEVKIDSEAVQIIAKITLMLILFTDASTIDLRSLVHAYKVPLRLLAIGLPLTMVLGIFVALPLFGEMSLSLIALMSFILSPTDAALGQAVVSREKVPGTVRDAIGVESGLNDGITLPPIMACMVALSAAVSFFSRSRGPTSAMWIAGRRSAEKSRDFKWFQ